MRIKRRLKTEFGMPILIDVQKNVDGTVFIKQALDTTGFDHVRGSTLWEWKTDPLEDMDHWIKENFLKARQEFADLDYFGKMRPPSFGAVWEQKDAAPPVVLNSEKDDKLISYRKNNDLIAKPPNIPTDFFKSLELNISVLPKLF